MTIYVLAVHTPDGWAYEMCSLWREDCEAFDRLATDGRIDRTRIFRVRDEHEIDGAIDQLNGRAQ